MWLYTIEHHTGDHYVLSLDEHLTDYEVKEAWYLRSGKVTSRKVDRHPCLTPLLVV